MKHLIVCLAIAFLSAGPGAAGQQEDRVSKAVADIEARLITTRRDFHMYPELSNREKRTSGVVAARLRELGFDDVRTGISNTGVVGLLKGAKPGPVVGIRADMDALPVEETNDVPYRSRNKGVKHACGHDVHTTVALGTAEVLSRMKADLAGSVKFIFQPAEEGPPEGEDSGADRMIREGVLDNPRVSAIFALHTNPELEAGTIGYAPGAIFASADGVTIRIIGRRAHAAWPHRGIDPVVIAAEVVTALQTIRSRRIDPLEPVVLTFGSIHGGNRLNIIAEDVVLQGTLRTHNEAVRERVISLVKEIVNGVAASHGASAEIRWVARSNPVTKNDTALVEATLPAWRAMLGEANVIKVLPVMGGEDFAFFERAIPGVMFFLGVGNRARGITAPLHAADYDVDEKCLAVGVRAMAAAVLEYLDRKR